jgi:hypothetical protein
VIEQVEIRTEDRTEVAACMAELDAQRSGWINVEPAFEEGDEPPPRPSMFGAFSGRGPDVPLATWTPAEQRGRRTEPASVGIQHASGPRAVARLAERGVPVPPGWRLLTDHPRRGLVVAIGDQATHDEVLAWLLAAAEALSNVRLTGRWLVTIHRRG